MKGKVLLLFLAACMLATTSMAQDYATYSEITSQLKQLSTDHPDLVKLDSIGTSRGGKDIWLVTLAANGTIESANRPALFIGGNIEGYRLTATEAAMATLHHFIENRDSEEITALLQTRTFYFVPVMNPDVMNRVQTTPVHEPILNSRPVNDDADDEIDEDGPDDINGDGYITMMRYRDPKGTMIIDENDPRLMKKADGLKGEIGEFIVICEGFDNDRDGRINEDAVGGINLNMNFPHDYQHFKLGAGPHPASEPEVIALLEFFFTHKNIAAAYFFGGESNLLNLQRGKGNAKSGSDMVKVNRQFARFLGLEEGSEMHIDELVEIIKASPLGSRMEVTRERVLQFMGGGPAMSIRNKDYAYYEKMSEWFGELWKEHELTEYANKPEPVLGDGSMTSWAYYHYGIPGFASSVWEMPKLAEGKKEETADKLTVEALKSMSSEDFLALGEEKITAFLKERGSDQRVTAKQLIGMVESGKVKPEQMAKMMEARDGQKKDEKKDSGEETKALDWMATNLPDKGFVEWQKFDHPSLGEVEIGGYIPLARVNPPYDLIKPNLPICAEFTVKLAKSLSQIELVEAKAERLEEGVYKITAYVENKGFLPTALSQGALSGQVQPVLVRLKGDQITLLSGRPMLRFNAIDGNSRTNELRWIIKAASGTKILLTANSQKSGDDSVTITLR